ncbi:MAG: hypothetical protein PHS44_01550 [Candidatus Dojkabacteria bacterium]|nr:hypothetical protein [Candidatus Dojkabacteria bacterium]
MNIGTTFDLERAQNWDLDWKASLKRVVDLGLSPVRIGIKWKKITNNSKLKTPRQRRARLWRENLNQVDYNWEEYDYILNYLHENKIPTILVTGMKSPQWPEYYIPENLMHNESTINASNAQLKKSLSYFITESIKRYSHFKNITHLQIENEPFLPAGPNKWRIPEELLRSEISLAHKLTSLPILLTAQGLPTTGVLAEYIRGRYRYKKRLVDYGDAIGLNIFPIIRDNFLFNTTRTFRATECAWKYFGHLVNKIRSEGKTCLVTELQAEPWEGKEPDFADPFGNTTCDPEMVRAYIKIVEKIGFDTILLWGIEFHLKCASVGNTTWLEMIRSLIHIQ